MILNLFISSYGNFSTEFPQTILIQSEKYLLDTLYIFFFKDLDWLFNVFFCVREKHENYAEIIIRWQL